MKAPKNLDQLFDYLVEGIVWDGAPMDSTKSNAIDWTSLPTFGGHELADTSGIWSWDATRMLVGTCVDDLEIIDW